MRQIKATKKQRNFDKNVTLGVCNLFLFLSDVFANKIKLRCTSTHIPHKDANC